MAARRNKTQARRNSGNGTPGWVWLIAGLVLGAAAFFIVPGLIRKDGDGFFRPQPNPDAQPAQVADADGNLAPETSTATSQPDARPRTRRPRKPSTTSTLAAGQGSADVRCRTRRQRARGTGTRRAHAEGRGRRDAQATGPANRCRSRKHRPATARHHHAVLRRPPPPPPRLKRARRRQRGALHPAGRRVRRVRRCRIDQGQDRPAGIVGTGGVGADRRQDRVPRAHGAIWQRQRTGRSQAEAASGGLPAMAIKAQKPSPSSLSSPPALFPPSPPFHHKPPPLTPHLPPPPRVQIALPGRMCIPRERQVRP